MKPGQRAQGGASPSSAAASAQVPVMSQSYLPLSVLPFRVIIIFAVQLPVFKRACPFEKGHTRLNRHVRLNEHFGKIACFFCDFAHIFSVS